MRKTDDEEALACLPPDLLAAIEARWGTLQPSRAQVEALIATARGGIPIAATDDPPTREAMRAAVFAVADAVMTEARRRAKRDLAEAEGARSGGVARRDALHAQTATRDAVIRREWARHPHAATKAQRALVVRRALKERAKAEGWELPGSRQMIRIGEGG